MNIRNALSDHITYECTIEKKEHKFQFLQGYNCNAYLEKYKLLSKMYIHILETFVLHSMFTRFAKLLVRKFLLTLLILYFQRLVILLRKYRQNIN